MKRIELSREMIDHIIELYKSGLSYDKIQNVTGINNNKIKRTIYGENVERRKRKAPRESFTERERKELIADYISGVEIPELTEKYDCNPNQIRKCLIDSNVKIRTRSQCCRKYQINENYFDQIDNQDKAYILGFLYADGTNASNYSKKYYRIDLTLQMRDAYILDRIREKLAYEKQYRIYTRKSDGRSYARLEIKNKQIAIKLNELGILKNKTFITQFPKWLRKDLIPHFIRGLLDGDGCISKDLKTVQFAGSDKMIDDLIDLFEEYLGFSAHAVRIKHSPGISSVAIARIDRRVKLLNWIYENADLKLERKYDLYLKTLEKYNNMYVNIR